MRSAKPPIRLSLAARKFGLGGAFGTKRCTTSRTTFTAWAAWSGRVCRPMVKAPACRPPKSCTRCSSGRAFRAPLPSGARQSRRRPGCGCPPAGQKVGSRRWKAGWPISTWAWAEAKGMACSAGALRVPPQARQGGAQLPPLAGRRPSSLATSSCAWCGSPRPRCSRGRGRRPPFGVKALHVVHEMRASVSGVVRWP